MRPAITVRKSVAGAIALLVVLACVARVVHLDADPYVSTWIGYVADEGRWSEMARSLALFGTPEVSPVGRLHLVISPGYQMVNYVTFRLFGVDFWSARIFSAVAGSVLVLTVFVALRRHLTPFALALGVVILAVETNLLAQSRMALPEIPSILGCLLAFLLLVLGRKTSLHAFIAGLLAAVALSMKMTSLPALLIFPAVILLSPQSGSVPTRILRLLLFVLGLALLLAGGAGLGWALGLVNLERLADAGGRALSFLTLAAPNVIVARFFDASDLEARNLMLLGAWYCSWMWLHRGAKAHPVASVLYIASGMWAGWWLVIWSSIEYLPGRYVVHFIVPATIHIMAGLSLARHSTLARIGTTLGEGRRLMKAMSLSWLVLPSALIGATLLLGLGEIVGWSLSRVAARIALIVALTGLLVAVAWHGASKERIVAAFLFLPVSMTLIWLGGRELGVFRLFWDFDTPTGLTVWALCAGTSVAACFMVVSRPRVRRLRGVAESCVVAYIAAVFLTQGGRPIIAPTYSIRDASRQLEQQISGAKAVRNVGADSLFLENRMRYGGPSGDLDSIDGIVVFEHGRVSRRFFDSGQSANFVRVRTYPLTINPRYEVNEGKFGPANIAVFRRP